MLQKAWSPSSAMLPSHTCNRTLPIQAKNCENVEHYDHERGRPRTMSLLFWSFTASHAQQNLLCCFSSSQPTILTFRSVRAYIAILLSIYIESYGTIAQSVWKLCTPRHSCEIKTNSLISIQNLTAKWPAGQGQCLDLTPSKIRS